MTVSEMHIELRFSLGQAGSNRNLKYKAEELDLVLNKQQDRFIQSCLKPRQDGSGGFEIDEYSTDKIRTLLKTASMVPYYKERWYECYLPSDYAFLVADTSLTRDLCGTAAVPQQQTLFLYGIRQELSPKATPPFYGSNIITLRDRSVDIPADLDFGNTFGGFNAKADVQFLVPHIASIGQWWWERVWDYNFPGYYLLISPVELLKDAEGNDLSSTCVVDGTTYVTTQSETRTEIVHPGGNKWVDNRLTASSRVGRLNGTEFYRTAHYSPVSELSGNILKVHNDTSFIVTNVAITYIRKPRPISLSLNSNSELPAEFHQTICDLSVEYLKGRLDNAPGQQLAERDIEKRVIL